MALDLFYQFALRTYVKFCYMLNQIIVSRQISLWFIISKYLCIYFVYLYSQSCVRMSQPQRGHMLPKSNTCSQVCLLFGVQDTCGGGKDCSVEASFGDRIPRLNSGMMT